MPIGTTVKKAIFNTAFNYIGKNPEENALKILDWVDKLAGDGPNTYAEHRKAIRKVLEDPSNNMYQLIMRIMRETDTDVLKAIFQNFFLLFEL